MESDRVEISQSEMNRRIAEGQVITFAEKLMSMPHVGEENRIEGRLSHGWITGELEGDKIYVYITSRKNDEFENFSILFKTTRDGVAESTRLTQQRNGSFINVTTGELATQHELASFNEALEATVSGQRTEIEQPIR